MSNPSSTARAITKATSSSLGLLNASAGLLSLAQLLTLKPELRDALAIVNGEIQDRLLGSYLEYLCAPFNSSISCLQGLPPLPLT